MKYCPRCTQMRPFSEFHRDRSKPDGFNVWCIWCHRETRKVRESDPVNALKKKNARWAWGLKKYGITADEYLSMYESQNGVCYICKEPDSREYKLAVDHCHKTGRVRRLLCGDCNLMIGNARERVEILESGIAYLREQEVI